MSTEAGHIGEGEHLRGDGVPGESRDGRARRAFTVGVGPGLVRRAIVTLLYGGLTFRIMVPGASEKVLTAALCFVGLYALLSFRPERLRGSLPMLLVACVLICSEYFADANGIFHGIYARRVYFSVVMNLLLPFVICSARDRRYALQLLLFGGVAVAFAALYQFRSNPFLFTAMRGGGFGVTDPNYLCLLIGLSTVLAMGRLIQGDLPLMERLLYYLVLAATGFVIIVLASRGAIIALLVATMAVLIMTWRGTRNKSTLLRVVMLLLVIGVVSYFAIGGNTLMERFTTLASSGAGGRTELWQVGIRGFASSPIQNMLFGRGIGGGSEMIGRQVVADAMDAHNNLLTILLDYGIFGLLAFAFLLLSAVRGIKFFPSDWRVPMAALLVFFVVASAGLSPIFEPCTWFLIGVFLVGPGGSANGIAVENERVANGRCEV